MNTLTRKVQLELPQHWTPEGMRPSGRIWVHNKAQIRPRLVRTLRERTLRGCLLLQGSSEPERVDLLPRVAKDDSDRGHIL